MRHKSDGHWCILTTPYQRFPNIAGYGLHFLPYDFYSTICYIMWFFSFRLNGLRVGVEDSNPLFFLIGLRWGLLYPHQSFSMRKQRRSRVCLCELTISCNLLLSSLLLPFVAVAVCCHLHRLHLFICLFISVIFNISVSFSVSSS